MNERSDDPSGGEPRYRLLRPVAGSERDGALRPLVLFLHGSGERGDDNEAQLKHAPFARESGFGGYLLAPQCPRGERWVDCAWDSVESSPMAAEPTRALSRAIAALERTLAEEPIDPERVCLTGLSMGGFGAFELACRMPERFAAVMPLCGGGDERLAARLASLPLWVWHGAEDPSVPVERSRRMVAAVREAGGSPRYSELPGVGHAVWEQAYGAGGALAWLVAQRRVAGR